MRLLTELPYVEDSTQLFQAIADQPWSIWLDSGSHALTQSRYDILSAEPYITLVTRGAMTEVRGAQSRLSRDDPLLLLRNYLDIDPRLAGDLPFTGGALGYFGYDLARRFERLPDRAADDGQMPDMAIGIYDWAVVVDHHERRSWLVGQGRDPATHAHWQERLARFSAVSVERARVPFRITAALSSSLSREAYATAFRRVLAYIDAGDCYQVNLSQRFSAPATGDPWLAYQSLRVANPAPRAAYLNTPYGQILCSSPESFLKVAHGRVVTQPIKGTRPRIGHARLDAERVRELQASAKDRAENVMIVDLLRNDLSKNCESGSVQVSKLFDVESFTTVHHLVSTINGRLRSDRDALDLLRGGFPGGSVTGAPKLRAMEIIEELEPQRRGVYCGALGYLGYDGHLDTNIIIRSLVYSAGVVHFSVGGGIVADSRLEDEYQETFDKAAALLKLLQQPAAHRAAPQV
jgi:para-aminobenzoate synthetase component 1